MRNKMNFRLTSMLVVALAVIASACTKSKELKNNVDTKAYFDKTVLLGDNAKAQELQTKDNPKLMVVTGSKMFHLSRGIEEADSDNDVGATPGMSTDFGLVRARITETELQFLSAFDTMGRPETMKVVASYPITAQFDIQRDKNDYGDDTNKIIEDTTQPWMNRRFMRVDWAHPSSSVINFAKGLDLERQANQDADGDLDSLLTSGMTEENTVLLENPTVTPDHISFLVETGVEKAGESATYVYPDSIQSPKAYRVVYRMHLLEAKNTDYEAVPYTLKDFDRFGFFFTQQNFSNPRGLLDSNVHLYANTHNVCEAGRSGSCSTNKIRWVLSKDFPEKYKDTARKVVKEWNQTFQQALNRTDEIVYLDESVQATISDPTMNVLAYYPSRTKSGLLGVAQWVSDPRNGQLIGVRATIYGDGIDYEVESVNQFIDILAAKSDGQALGVPDTGLPEQYDSAFAKEVQAASSLMQANKAEAKMLGLNKRRSSNLNSGVNMQMQIQQALSDGSFALARSSMRAVALAQKLPQFYALTNLQTMIDSLTPEMKRELPRETYGLAIPKLNGLESIAFAEEDLKTNKKQMLREAASGVHGTDLVEDAAIRFLLRKIAAGSKPSDLAAHKEEIDNEIAQETFYTTALHEMGHTFGLRHNFAGSADSRHYSPEYYDIQKNVAAGKAAVEDLDPYASSSIMDYGRDFYSQQGGLGPYDKAAIKYAYNRSINKESDAVTLAHYKFCTDHQVGEDLLCRRFDKGANLVQQIQSYIDYYNHNYALMHYRRGRLSEDNMHGWGSPRTLMSSLLQRVFLPIRQVMDEELYAYLASPDSGKNTGSLCDKAIVMASINAGEIANICSNANMERAGVDTTDVWGTLSNALFDQDTGGIRKDPDTYIPNGFADILLANEMAKKFFNGVIGSAEPGDYVAWQNSANQYVLHALPEEGKTLEEKLASVADDLQVPADKDFMAKAKKQMISLTISGKGRQLEDRSSDPAGFTINDSLGSFWDKYAAMRALAIRYYGVDKYNAHSMALNAYFAPQTKSWAAGLFGAVIGEAQGFSTILMPVVGKDGNAVMANVFVPASLDSNTLSVSSMLAVAGLTSETDTSMLTKLKICDVNEGECGQAASGSLIEYHSAERNETYRAYQTIDGDSIAYNILAEAKQYDDMRTSIAKKIADANKTQGQDIMSISNAESLRDQIVTDISAIPSMQGLIDNPLKGQSGQADKITKAARLAMVVTEAWTLAEDVGDATPFVAIEEAGQAATNLTKVSGVVDALLKATSAENDGKEQLALQNLQANLKKATDLIKTATQSSITMKQGSNTISRITSLLKQKDSKIENLRKLTYQASHMSDF